MTALLSACATSSSLPVSAPSNKIAGLVEAGLQPLHPCKAAAPATKGMCEIDAHAFVEMMVVGIVPTPDGHMLVLINPDEEVLLPLGIGLPEALSIHGRLERRTTTRPLTHDLLDHVVQALGGEVIRVQIDDVRPTVSDGLPSNLVVGTVVLRKDEQELSLDARPSDAVALALGNRVPIWVSRRVLDRAAIRPDDLPQSTEAPPTPSSEPTRGILSL